MSVEKINPVYQANTKQDGDALPATEWNAITNAVNIALTKINEVIDEGTGGGAVTVETDPLDQDKRLIFTDGTLTGELTDKGAKGVNVTVAGNNNINIEPRPAVGTGEGKNEAGNPNRKGGNISLKPGDDIELCSHKRGSSKNTEVNVKTIDGSDNPVKLQIMAGEITLSSKDKNKTRKKNAAGEDIKTPYMTKASYSGGILPVVQSDDKYYLAAENKATSAPTSTEVAGEYVTTAALYDDPNVTNINITTGSGKGYLKVRAQAIDLRSEAHGGIALQPRGNDGLNHENKIKFEHGGGDGLEFATFNTEKTSVFTDEYRFNKAGVLKVATRVVVDNTPGQGGNDKYVDENIDPTTHYSYQKQADDFYDVISQEDPTCTWKDVVTTSSIFAKPANGVRIEVIGGTPMSRDLAIRFTTVEVIDDSEFDPEFDTLIDGLTLTNPAMELPSVGTKLTINELFDYFYRDTLEEILCNTASIAKLNGSVQVGTVTVTKHLTVRVSTNTVTFRDLIALVNANT